jgi:hypothetical protein
VPALDVDHEAAAAGRIEAVADQAGVDLRAHAPQQRQEHLGDELEGRRHRVVGAALEGQARACRARAAAATAPSAAPASPSRRCRPRRCSRRGTAPGVNTSSVLAELVADDLGRADRGGRADGREVLAQQARLDPARADAVQPERPPVTSDRVKAERRICPPPSPCEPSISILSFALARAS